MGFFKRLFGARAEKTETAPPPPPAPSPPSRGEAVPPSFDRGIFAGLFLAQPEAVEAWHLEGLTPPDWPALEFKRLETVKLGTLEAILTQRPYESIDQDDLHNDAGSAGDEGPWLSRVRGSLVSALADLQTEQLESAAAAWADTDEFKLQPRDKPSRRDIDELAGLLAEMSRLARLSRESGNPMYLMMSL
jgi:hypothetical protein